MHKLNYQNADICPLSYYKSPIREQAIGMNLRAGRYHQDYKGLTRPKNIGLASIKRVRTIGINLYYDNPAMVLYPYNIRYIEDGKGNFAIHMGINGIKYDEHESEYKEFQEYYGKSNVPEYIYMGSRDKTITGKQFLREALGNQALTSREVSGRERKELAAKNKVTERVVARIDEDRRKNQVLANAKEEDQLTPEELTRIVREKFSRPRAKFINAKTNKKAFLRKDEEYEKLMKESAIGPTFSFNGSNKKVMQKVRIEQVPMRQKTRQTKEFGEITYYEVANERERIDTKYPTPYLYKLYIIDNKESITINFISTRERLEEVLSKVVEVPNIDR